MDNTAAALSAEIQLGTGYLTATRLKKLTNYGENSATAVDTDVLLKACQRAIRQFERAYTHYDPANYPDHGDVAEMLVALHLYKRTGDLKKQKEVTDEVAEMTRDFRERRRLAPMTNAARTPTPDDSNKRPPFDDKDFEDILVD